MGCMSMLRRRTGRQSNQMTAAITKEDRRDVYLVLETVGNLDRAKLLLAKKRQERPSLGYSGDMRTRTSTVRNGWWILCLH
jgi:hypothetical protein